MTPNPTTLHDAETLAAAHGIAFSPRDRAAIADAQAAERERLQKLDAPAGNTWADRWNTFYPKLLEAIISIGETVLTFSQTIIVSLGVPVVLVLLLIVEHQRVVHGIMLFEADSALASFAAAALVILNLVLEFQTHHLEHRAGYSEGRAAAWSLRIGWQNAAYWLGIGSQWTPRPLSPAQRYRKLLRLVTFSILALALAGSMRAVIEATPGAWYAAIGAILAESDLLTMLTWLGGLLFAAAAVLSAQGLSRYVAIRCVEIIATMHERQQQAADPHAGEVERAGAVVALAILNDKLAKRAVKSAAIGAQYDNPLEVLTIHSNGNGRH